MNSQIESGKPELLKRMNRQLVIAHIVRSGRISRSQLAKETGLALPSVMRITEDLSEEGIIIDWGKGSSTGGRKPALVEINAKYKYIFGIEIAIESSLVLTDFSGQKLDEWRSDQMTTLDPEELLEVIFKEFLAMKARHGLHDDQIAGIGIGTPGSNFKHPNLIKRSVLKGWEAIDIGAWFRTRIDLPVVVDNVARTRTLSELWFGHGKTCKNFLYVFVDQGVGVGIVKKGEIEVGVKGVAGEFGHMSIAYDGRQCYCGKKGCIEMYVSAGAITNEADKLSQMKNEGSDMSFSDVLLKKEEKAIQNLLWQSGDYLAFGIANLINLYNPQMVVLGGIVPLSSETVVHALNEQVGQYIFNNHALNTPIVVSDIPLSKSYLGSIALVINAAFLVV